MPLRPPFDHQLTPYQRAYIARVPLGADILTVLRDQVADVEACFLARPGGCRYAEGKWSLAELLGHLVDTEQILAGRLRRVARGDRTPQPGFDQDLYVRNGGAEGLSPEALLAEFRLLREALILQVENTPEEAWDREGVANGAPVLARLYPFMVAGHVDHHLQIVRERYHPCC